MKKSFVAILCLFIAIVTLLSACGGNTNTPQATTEAPAGENNNNNNNNTPVTPQGTAQDTVPQKDINRDFVILNDFAVEGDIHKETGDAVWDSKVSMYLFAEEKYNITISFKKPSSGYAWETLQMLSGSDQNEYDLLSSPHPNTGIYNLLTSGNVVDINTVNTVNLNGQWYNQSQVQNHTTKGKLFLVVPDYGVDGQALVSVIYNEDRYTSLGFTEDLYATVKAGDWTIDKMISMVKEASPTNIDANTSTATYGLGYWKSLTYTVMYAMGENILVKNANGEFQRGLNVERLELICDKLEELVLGSECATIMNDTNNAGLPDTDMWKAFASGRTLFFTMDVGGCFNNLRDLEFDLNYLPLPKLYKTEDYRSVCASGFACIPSIAYNAEESGLILETMAIYGNEHVKPTVFETILLGRLSQDTADYEMLNYLHSTKFYEFGWTFDETGVGRNLVTSIVFGTAGNGGSKAITAYIRGHAKDFERIVSEANALGQPLEA